MARRLGEKEYGSFNQKALIQPPHGANANAGAGGLTNTSFGRPLRRSTINTTKGRILPILCALLGATTFSLILRGGVPTAPRWVDSILHLTHNSKHNPVPSTTTTTVTADPASQWQDNIWPLRQPSDSEAWDISTDFKYPRKLEYDVEEGTWLRLDVHPKSGDVVFDMVGDLWCLSGSEAATGNVVTDKIRARPVLLGIPHDSDPHFSPEGERLVFRSDAENGVDNIWVLKWSSCDEMDLRGPNALMGNEKLRVALQSTEEEEALLNGGMKETEERKVNRLVREGRFGAQRLTNETYRFISDARFHPSGDKVIATKWYTSSRSLGAGEGWEYQVPTPAELSSGKVQKKVQVGSGQRVVSRSLPRGWTAEQYGNQQIGPEQVIWRGEDAVVYAKNVRDASSYSYSKDVHAGIYAIYSYNLTTQSAEQIVGASPGGASRPELSRDGRTLAFVRRVRDKEALVLKDLETGTLTHIWHGLDYDVSSSSAPMGTYPSFSFSPSDDAIFIWSSGQIHYVPLTTNSRNERVGAGQPQPIKFTAHIEKRLAETRKDQFDILGLETSDTQRVYALKDLRVNEDGSKVVFHAGGINYVQNIGVGGVTPLPVLDKSAPYYAPSFVYGSDELVLQARWSDTNFTSFELSNTKTGISHPFVDIPFGRYISATLCECSSKYRTIAFVKTGGTYLTGDIIATAGEGLYIADVELPPLDATKPTPIKVTNWKFVTSDVYPEDRLVLQFFEGNQKLLVQQSSRAFVIDLGKGPISGGLGEYEQTTVASGYMSQEIVVEAKLLGGTAEYVAFVDFFNVYLVPGKQGEDVWSKPENATKGLVKLNEVGGHDLVFSGDGSKVFWLLGPNVHWLETSKLQSCNQEISLDRNTFGVHCVQKISSSQEVFIEHSTDIARLKQEAKSSDTVVVINARILTMANGNAEQDLINSGVLVVRGGVIQAIHKAGLFDLEKIQGATVIDAEGGFVIPGFIDVHAHWNGFSDLYPAKSWEMEAFLAYGVTTLHNPSASNVNGFVERTRVERGQTIGPRIFQVGDIIYGAGEAGIHQDIVDIQEARSALERIRAEGGPAHISYKNYNIPSRAARQRLLSVAKNLTMLCVPEGGMNYDWDLTYIIDGMTTVEHALPIPVLYDDVKKLFVLSGTQYTPTHLVNYGGAAGEQWVWATEDVPNDPKLREFVRHDILQEITESTARPKHSYVLFNTSASASSMVSQGLHTLIGAHGEPPIGLNFHAEMWFTRQGGLTNYQTLQAATSWAAEALGMDKSLGTLEFGKLADFLIYPPGVDLLSGDIKRTRDLKLVVRGGRIWNAKDMEEVWPVKGRKQVMPPLNPE
ncbi:hypothetical protein BDN72DRAFT_763687 [Pluteus cervinus]|uniref:Uncharacterized protein n=1 Tax=Pluteus cervinus TaxID=181527 RepID=A0ACD3B5J6_9AGAR|nr:hypothetical protein BDN72DRAFT_763687 [Pluteus cervinus]